MSQRWREGQSEKAVQSDRKGGKGMVRKGERESITLVARKNGLVVFFSFFIYSFFLVFTYEKTVLKNY